MKKKGLNFKIKKNFLSLKMTILNLEKIKSNQKSLNLKNRKKKIHKSEVCKIEKEILKFEKFIL